MIVLFFRSEISGLACRPGPSPEDFKRLTPALRFGVIHGRNFPSDGSQVEYESALAVKTDSSFNWGSFLEAPDSAAFAPELPIKETTIEHWPDLG